MRAIEHLCAAGFIVELVGADGIGITPAESLNDRHREWIKSNKSRILQELAAANDSEIRWQQFIDMAVSLGAKPDEVRAMFTEQAVQDLLEEPDSKLPLHAKTIAQAAIRKCRVVPIKASIQIPTDNLKTCGNCQHFRRTKHPHIGKCSAGEPTGSCGNWDADSRNYCQSFKAVTL